MPIKRRSTNGFPQSYRQEKGTIGLGEPPPIVEEVVVPFLASCEVNSYDVGDRAAYHDCDHWRWRVVDSSNPTVRQTNSSLSSDPYWEMSNTAYWLIANTLPSSPEDAGLFGSAWDVAVEHFDWAKIRLVAYKSLLKQVHINRQISIVNFLLELRDVKKLFDIWSHRRSVLKNLANAQLNYSFGWKPFLSDVCTILDALTNTRRKLKELLRKEGQIRILRGTVRKAFPVPTAFGVLPIVPSLGPLRVFPVETVSSFDSSDLDCRYTVKYSYAIPLVSKLQAEMRAYCDAFGVNWDPQIIWDAIPFSFVVDWFFDVGGWLNAAFNSALIEPIVRIHEVCFTVVGVQTLTCEATIPVGDVSLSDPSTSHASVTIQGKRFHRRLSSLSKADLTFAGWTHAQLQKLSLGLSLVTTNARPKRVKRLPRR